MSSDVYPSVASISAAVAGGPAAAVSPTTGSPETSAATETTASGTLAPCTTSSTLQSAVASVPDSAPPPNVTTVSVALRVSAVNGAAGGAAVTVADSPDAISTPAALAIGEEPLVYSRTSGLPSGATGVTPCCGTAEARTMTLSGRPPAAAARETETMPNSCTTAGTVTVLPNIVAVRSGLTSAVSDHWSATPSGIAPNPRIGSDILAVTTWCAARRASISSSVPDMPTSASSAGVGAWAVNVGGEGSYVTGARLEASYALGAGIPPASTASSATPARSTWYVVPWAVTAGLTPKVRAALGVPPGAVPLDGDVAVAAVVPPVGAPYRPGESEEGSAMASLNSALISPGPVNDMDSSVGGAASVAVAAVVVMPWSSRSARTVPV